MILAAPTVLQALDVGRAHPGIPVFVRLDDHFIAYRWFRGSTSGEWLVQGEVEDLLHESALNGTFV